MTLGFFCALVAAVVALIATTPERGVDVPADQWASNVVAYHAVTAVLTTVLICAMCGVFGAIK